MHTITIRDWNLSSRSRETPWDVTHTRFICPILCLRQFRHFRSCELEGKPLHCSEVFVYGGAVQVYWKGKSNEHRDFPNNAGGSCCPRTWRGTATGDAGDGRKGGKARCEPKDWGSSFDGLGSVACCHRSILDRKNRIKASSTPTLHVGFEASRLVKCKLSNTAPESYQPEKQTKRVP